MAPKTRVRHPKKPVKVSSSSDELVEEIAKLRPRVSRKVKHKENECKSHTEVSAYEGDEELSSDNGRNTGRITTLPLSPSRFTNLQNQPSKSTPQNKYSGKKVLHSYKQLKIVVEKCSDSSSPNTELLPHSTSTPVSAIKKLQQLSIENTSTPNERIAQKQYDFDTCFGFDNILFSDPSDISPVKTTPHQAKKTTTDPASNTSIYKSSVKYNKLNRSFTHKRLIDHAFFVDIPRKKPKRPKVKAKTEKELDDWAAKMNAQFEEIEMHELSIE